MYQASKRIASAIWVTFSTEIEDTLSAINAAFDEQDLVSIQPDAFRSALWNLIHRHVWQQSHRLFVYEFHSYRRSLSLPIDPTSSQAFDAFCAELDETVIADWLKRYGIWEQMVTTCLRNTLSFLSGMAHHLRRDATELTAAGLIAHHATLTGLAPLDSDPHNGAKVVLALEFDDRPKLIYKPRSLALDAMIRDIFTEIVRSPLLKQQAPVPLTLDRKDHGWQEWVQTTALDSSELPIAYRKLGLCSAVLTALGSTDIHDENVVFTGSHPWFIDLETGMHGTWQMADSTLAGALEDTVARSVCTTSIIPAKLPTIPKSLLVGAINTPLPQTTTEEVFTLRNPATDAVDIARSVQQMTREQVPLKLVTGEAPDPLPYQQDFVVGYREGYRRVMQVREVLITHLMNADFPVRRILRPTAYYAHFLSAALFAKNLADEHSMDRLLSHLNAPQQISEFDGSQILVQEKIALLSGDIPFASSGARSTSIKVGNHETESVFAASPIQNAIDSLRVMSEDRLLQDERIIAEGFSYIRAHQAESKKGYPSGHPAPMFKKAVDHMTADNPGALVELLASLAVHFKGESPEISWLNGTYGNSPISYHSTGLISLHDTGGLLFLTEQLEEGSDPLKRLLPAEFNASAHRGLISLQKAYQSGLAQAPASIISGNPSLEFVLGHKGRRLPLTEEYVRKAFAHPEPRDVFAGELGLAVTLATFPDTPASLLQIMHSRVEQVLTHDSLSDGGIAHGRLGAIWAALRLAKRLGDSAFIQRTTRDAARLEFHEGWMGSGWCNGRAGLLMLASEIPAEFQKLLPARPIAESVLAMPDGPIDLGICHGAGGTLQALLYAGQCMADPWYVDLAHEYWTRSLTHAQRHGFHVGEPNKDHLIGYLLGWGGVAHSAVLLRAYKRGETSWIPISLAHSVEVKK